MNMDGPVVLVGHSYGGLLISEAGVEPQVKALVYVAAFLPQMSHPDEIVAIIKEAADSVQ